MNLALTDDRASRAGWALFLAGVGGMAASSLVGGVISYIVPRAYYAAAVMATVYAVLASVAILLTGIAVVAAGGNPPEGSQSSRPGPLPSRLEPR